MRERIGKRPVLWLVGASLVALLIGIGIGAAVDTDEETISDLEAQVAELEDQLADAEEERDEARDERLEAVMELEDAREGLEDRERRLERRAERLAEQEEPEPDDDTHTVGDFRITDVQVREDFVGDFEVRARVENTGGGAEFVRLEATLFSGGSVVATASSVEDFDAGQTRTVTFTSTDDYGPWDDIEFTIDR